MTYYKGVNVREGQGISTISGASQTVTGIMGTFKKGVLNEATVVNNMAEFEQVFGNRPLTGVTSYYDVAGFYATCGEAPLAIVNVKGPSAAKATKTIQDIHGTPKNTLTIRAASEGDWGENLSVDVVNQNVLVTGLLANVSAAAVTAQLRSTTGLEVGSYLQFYNGTNTEKVELTAVNQTTGFVTWVGGLTYAYTTVNGVISSLEFKIIVSEASAEVERWEGLSMNDNVTFFCEKIINGNSDYIEVVDLDSASTPGYMCMPAPTSSAQALLSGDDDLASIESTHWIGSASASTGLYAFAAVPNLFRIACPNPKIATSADAGYIAVVQALLSFANTQQDIQVYAHVPYNKTSAEAVTFAGNFEGRRLCLWYQWLKTTDNGATVWLPPVGPVLGAAAKKDADRGIYKNVGNELLGYGDEVERTLTRTEEETLNDAFVNTIIMDNGMRVWGGRTKSATSVFRFISHSEQFNDLSRTLKAETRDVAFEPNNAGTRAKLLRRVDAYLSEKVREGGVISYLVQCDEKNNPDGGTPGVMYCDITLQFADVAEKIVFTVTPNSVTIKQAA